jgi:hypothetical protein
MSKRMSSHRLLNAIMGEPPAQNRCERPTTSMVDNNWTSTAAAVRLDGLAERKKNDNSSNGCWICTTSNLQLMMGRLSRVDDRSARGCNQAAYLSRCGIKDMLRHLLLFRTQYVASLIRNESRRSITVAPNYKSLSFLYFCDVAVFFLLM